MTYRVAVTALIDRVRKKNLFMTIVELALVLVVALIFNSTLASYRQEA